MSHAPLPIDEILDALLRTLKAGSSAVLVAPPGAGKTTRVPLALLEAGFLEQPKIIIAEPRRLAARAAASRMASLLGEDIGRTIGLRVRGQSLTGPLTRIEVVTEGVLVRMLLDDPGLEGVGAILLDEYHERSLDADLSLALALDIQNALRPDLRLLVMSATLDGARIAALMGDAPVLESQGRAYPVTTHYLGRDPAMRLEEAMGRAILQALALESGSILAFLPGSGEIARTQAFLCERLRDPAILLAPLHGAMDRAAQDKAISPAPHGSRKIVLASAIAETSLTIEGVRVVVDSGLARVPRFEPDLGLTRLETVRVSRAAADQRRGRAGRTQPGVCYRLWEEAANGALPAFARPEILDADLSSLTLDLAMMGVRDAGQLTWLDPPPAPALKEARSLLQELDALDKEGAITLTGRQMQALPLPVRLSSMMLAAAVRGCEALAAEIAAVLTERGLGGDSPDLGERIVRFRRDGSPRGQEARRLARQWAQQGAQSLGRKANMAELPAEDCGPLLAIAYPDRIAKARGQSGPRGTPYLLANGRAAMLEFGNSLSRSPFLVVAEMVGRAADSRILIAASLDEAQLEAVAGARMETRDETSFDPASASLRSRRLRRLGAITLQEQTLAVPKGPGSALLLARGIAALGIHRLPFSKAQLQWRDRVEFLRRSGGSDLWPDVSDEALGRTAGEWLGPFIEERTSLATITPDDLRQALATLLPWELSRRLEAEAPTHFETPAGSSHALNYTDEGPVLAVRVQELYGLNAHPCLAGGRVPIILHLLSPAHRPMQITRDLPGFWKGSWAAVKADMKGRYPRHPWPDDPSAALPTTRAKPRGT